jgi:hypothetical protein
VADSVRGSCLCGRVTFDAFRPASGKVKAFCAERGSSLFRGDWPEGADVSVRLGSLDGDPQIRPQYHTFVGARAPWDELPDDGLPRYEGPNPAER